MKKLTAFAATLLLSSSVFAGTNVNYGHNNFRIGYFANAAETNEVGYDLADQIDVLSPSQQRNKFRLLIDNSTRGIKADDSKTGIENFSEPHGEHTYQTFVSMS